MRQTTGVRRNLNYPHAFLACPTYLHGYCYRPVATPSVTWYWSELRSRSKPPHGFWAFYLRPPVCAPSRFWESSHALENLYQFWVPGKSTLNIPFCSRLYPRENGLVHFCLLVQCVAFARIQFGGSKVLSYADPPSTYLIFSSYQGV